MWWHLKTGEWIAENGSLPTEDPFSYATQPGAEGRKNLLLKGYWLSELIYHFIFNIAGFIGLAVLKAFLFTLVFFVLWIILVKKGMGVSVGALFVLPLVLLCKPFNDLRPAVFSLIFTLLFFLLIEKGLEALKTGETNKKPFYLLFLSPLMLLWANLHPGFIIGYFMSFIYIMAETIKYLTKKDPLNKNNLLVFVSLVLIADVFSLFNPNFISPLPLALSDLSNPGVGDVAEYISPLGYARQAGAPFFIIGLALVGITTLPFIILSGNKLRGPHALLYAGFALAGFSSFRFSVFFILMSVAITSEYIVHVAGRTFTFINKAVSVSLILSSILLVNSSYKGSIFSHGPIQTEFLPVESTDFLLEHRLPEPIFNPYGWGGYLIWRLYPEYKVSMDGRMIDFDSYKEYSAAVSDDNTKVFDKYGINTVIFFYINPLEKDVDEIIFSLLWDDEWSLVFLDEISVIFVRNSALPVGIPVAPKGYLWDRLSESATAWSKEEPNNARPFILLGKIYYKKDDLKTAEGYFLEALNIDPANDLAAMGLAAIRQATQGR